MVNNEETNNQETSSEEETAQEQKKQAQPVPPPQPIVINMGTIQTHQKKRRAK